MVPPNGYHVARGLFLFSVGYHTPFKQQQIQTFELLESIQQILD